jgi:recombination protein RecA
MDKELESFVTAINKSFGTGSVTRMGDDQSKDITQEELKDRIHTGLRELDWATGGGLVKGVMHEIFGNEGEGKTTLAIHCMVNAQKEDPNLQIFFCDAEHTLNVEYAVNLGLDRSRVVISYPDFGEQGLDIIQQAVESGLFGMVVIDSVTALVPKADIDGDFTDANMGAHARLMSKMCRVLTPLIDRHNVCLVLINQIRMKIGVFMGSPETTTGGKGIRFYAGMRMRVSSSLVDKDDPKEKMVTVDFKKQKWGTPYRKIELKLTLGKGFDLGYDALCWAVREKKITQKSSAYYYEGEYIGSGKAQASIGLLKILEEESNG